MRSFFINSIENSSRVCYSSIKKTKLSIISTVESNGLLDSPDIPRPELKGRASGVTSHVSLSCVSDLLCPLFTPRDPYPSLRTAESSPGLQPLLHVSHRRGNHAVLMKKRKQTFCSSKLFKHKTILKRSAAEIQACFYFLFFLFTMKILV